MSRFRLYLYALYAALLAVPGTLHAEERARCFVPHVPFVDRCERSLKPETLPLLQQPLSNGLRKITQFRSRPTGTDLQEGLDWWLHLGLNEHEMGYTSAKISALIQDGKIKNRAEFLISNYSPSSPYYQLLLEANPNFLSDLKYPDPKKLSSALTRIYERNGIPVDRRIYPGRVYSDSNGKYHFLKETELDSVNPEWKALEGVIENKIFFDSLRAGVHIMIPKFMYEIRFRTPVYLHEFGHFVSYTQPRYNAWIHEYLALEKNSATEKKYAELLSENMLFESSIEMKDSGKMALDSVLRIFADKTTGWDFKSLAAMGVNKSSPKFRAAISKLKNADLVKTAKETLAIVDNDLILYGGSHWDLFSSRSGRLGDGLFNNTEGIQRRLKEYAEKNHFIGDGREEIVVELPELLAYLNQARHFDEIEAFLNRLKSAN